MTRLIIVLGLLAGLLAGCINPHALGVKDGEGAKAVSQRQTTVYPEQVNENNSHAMADALAAEMELNSRQDVKMPVK